MNLWNRTCWLATQSTRHAASAKSSAKSGERTRARLRLASFAEAISFADSENLCDSSISTQSWPPAPIPQQTWRNEHF
jgi:hypothetical protein